MLFLGCGVSRTESEVVSGAEIDREVYYHCFLKVLTKRVIIDSSRNGQRRLENAYKLIFVYGDATRWRVFRSVGSNPTISTILYASIRKLAKRPASKAVVCEFDSHSKYH